MSGACITLVPHPKDPASCVCHFNRIQPGTANFSSGLTSKLVASAARCDQARILRRLQGGIGGCCDGAVPPMGRAVAASSLELKKQSACQVVGPEALLFPRNAVSEGARIQNRMDNTILCGSNPSNPETRFASYVRIVPAGPACVPMTAAQLNSTQPKPSLEVCQPSRFF